MRQTFGRYTLLRRLAVGGMAEIFLAELRSDAGFSKQVVVKRILPHLEADADFLRMFVDEANLAARLSHPNVVQTHDFGAVDGSHFIAMEYIPGVDLHRMARLLADEGRWLDAATVAAIGEGVARGLAHTHGLTDEHGQPLGIVHRDVSPHNIMVSVGGDPKLMDFGIAKAAARGARTSTGTVKGKLAYMAPEQARGESASQASDQFALGVVLWEQLARRRIYGEVSTDVELMRQVIAHRIDPLREAAPHVDPRLAAIVERALAHDPAERFGSLEQMRAALAAYRAEVAPADEHDLGALVRHTLELQATVAAAADWSWREAGTRRLAAAPAAPADNAAAAARETARIGSQPLDPRRLQATTRLKRAAPGRRLAARHLTLAWMALISLGLPTALWLNASGRPARAAGHQHAGAPGHAHLADGQRAGGRLSLTTPGTVQVVWLGGRRLGTTPLRDVPLAAGHHSLVLAAEDGSGRHTLEVYVPAGGQVQETAP